MRPDHGARLVARRRWVYAEVERWRGRPVNTLRDGLKAFVRARFDRARSELSFQPAVRVALQAAEAFMLGVADDLCDWLNQPKEMAMSDKVALKAAGCPDQHCDQLAAAGVTAEQVKQLQTVGSIDWSKLLQLVQQYGPQVLALILGLFGKTPATPGAPPTP